MGGGCGSGFWSWFLFGLGLTTAAVSVAAKATSAVAAETSGSVVAVVGSVVGGVEVVVVGVGVAGAGGAGELGFGVFGRGDRRTTGGERCGFGFGVVPALAGCCGSVVASGEDETDDEGLLGMMRDASCAVEGTGATRATAGRGRRIAAAGFSCRLSRLSVGPATVADCCAGGVAAGRGGSVAPAPAAIVVPCLSLLGG